jgi:PilZ domain
VTFVTGSIPAAHVSIDSDGRVAARPLAHRATLLSQRDGRPYPATVHSWRESGTGLAARVSVREGAALRLAANHVWMSLLPAGSGFAVYSGRARRVAETCLDLTHLEPLAHEGRRRVSPRVPTDVPVTVHATGRPVRHGRVVDLSRGGLRLAPLGREALDVEERVTLDLRLDGVAVVVRGVVVRVDRDSETAVVRFESGPAEHHVALDRFVLTRLDANGAQSATRSARLARSATGR